MSANATIALQSRSSRAQTAPFRKGRKFAHASSQLHSCIRSSALLRAFECTFVIRPSPARGGFRWKRPNEIVLINKRVAPHGRYESFLIENVNEIRLTGLNSGCRRVGFGVGGVEKGERILNGFFGGWFVSEGQEILDYVFIGWFIPESILLIFFIQNNSNFFMKSNEWKHETKTNIKIPFRCKNFFLWLMVVTHWT